MVYMKMRACIKVVGSKKLERSSIYEHVFACMKIPIKILVERPNLVCALAITICVKFQMLRAMMYLGVHGLYLDEVLPMVCNRLG
jgi:hypothetical protein